MEKMQAKNKANLPPEGYHEVTLDNGSIVWADADGNAFLPQGSALEDIASPRTPTVVIDNEPRFKISLEMEGYGVDTLRRTLHSVGGHAMTQEIMPFTPSETQPAIQEGIAGYLNQNTPPIHPLKNESYTITGDSEAGIAPYEDEDDDEEEEEATPRQDNTVAHYERQPRKRRKAARRLAFWGIILAGGVYITGTGAQAADSQAKNCGAFVPCYFGHLGDGHDPFYLIKKLTR